MAHCLLQEKTREVRQKCFRALQSIVYLNRLAGEGLQAFLHRAWHLLQAQLVSFPPNVAQYINSYYADRMGKILW